MSTQHAVRTVLPDFPPEALHGALVFGGETPGYLELTGKVNMSGRCYEAAALFAIDLHERLTNAQLGTLSLMVHHGSIEGYGNPRIGHAWVTFRAKAEGLRIAYDVAHFVAMPEPVWKRWAGARTVRRYDAASTVRLAAGTDHCGPWHPFPFGLEDCSHGVAVADCEYGCTEDTLKG